MNNAIDKEKIKEIDAQSYNYNMSQIQSFNIRYRACGFEQWEVHTCRFT